ncbi:MAG: hypothetical protein ABEK59_06665 [Halobacteria archaeon]
MIVVDTSALVTLSTAGTVEIVSEEFDVHTTQTVISELSSTAEYRDIHGKAAEKVLEFSSGITVHGTEDLDFESSRVDRGEASCAVLTRQKEFEFLVSDDLRAVPELQNLSDAKLVISPVLLKALVKREVLGKEKSKEIVEEMAENRDWLGSPIYRKAKRIFEDE